MWVCASVSAFLSLSLSYVGEGWFDGIVMPAGPLKYSAEGSSATA